MGAAHGTPKLVMNDAVIERVEPLQNSERSGLVMIGRDVMGQRVAIEIKVSGPSSSGVHPVVAADLISMGSCPKPQTIPHDVVWKGDRTADQAMMRWYGRPPARSLRRLLPFRARYVSLRNRDSKGAIHRVLFLADPLALVPATGLGLAAVEAPSLVNTTASMASLDGITAMLREAGCITELSHTLMVVLSASLLGGNGPDELQSNWSFDAAGLAACPSLGGVMPELQVALLPNPPVPRTPMCLLNVISVSVPMYMARGTTTFYATDITAISGEKWRVWRRYKSFQQLQEKLEKHIPAAYLPKAAAVKLTGTYLGKPSAKTLDQRKEKIQVFLNTMLSLLDEAVPEEFGTCLLSFLEATYRNYSVGPGQTVIIQRQAQSELIGLNYSHDGIVMEVQKGGPADVAGLEVGLRLVTIDGRTVHSDIDAKEAFSDAGREIRVTVFGWWIGSESKNPIAGDSDANSGILWSDPSIRSLLKDRSGRQSVGSKKVSFKDGDVTDVCEYTQPKQLTKPGVPVIMGRPRSLLIKRDDPSIKVGLNYHNLVITQVQEGGLGEAAGFRPGMRLLSVNGVNVTSDGDVKAAFLAAGTEFVAHVLEDAVPMTAGTLAEYQHLFKGLPAGEGAAGSMVPFVAMCTKDELGNIPHKDLAGVVPPASHDDASSVSRAPDEVMINCPPNVNCGLTLTPNLEVASVLPDSPAEQAGAHEYLGRRVLRVNGKLVFGRGDVEEALAGSSTMHIVFADDDATTCYSDASALSHSTKATASTKPEGAATPLTAPPKVPAHIAALIGGGGGRPKPAPPATPDNPLHSVAPTPAPPPNTTPAPPPAAGSPVPSPAPSRIPPHIAARFQKPQQKPAASPPMAT